MIIYKYRPWNDNTKKIISSKGLWFPRISDLNDPFEGDIFINDGAYYMFMIRLTKSSGDKREPAEIRKDLETVMQSRKIQPQVALHHIRDFLRRTNYIFSASSVNDNILMWSHYANEHKGVCLGLEFDMTKCEFRHRDDIIIVKSFKFDTVDYSDERMLLNVSESGKDNYSQLLKRKNSVWSMRMKFE